MGQSSYTDEQRVQIGKAEYNTYEVGDPVKIDHDKTTIGYVSEVFPGENGLNGYVVTDKPGVSPSDAQHVTVLFAGTNLSDSGDLGADADIMLSVPIGGGAAPAQCQSASDELDHVIEAYPNAKIDVYGHSLGSTNAQYALANLNEEQRKHLGGAWLYEGPNAYGYLIGAQQKYNAARLTVSGKVHNYTDSKDLVPIGYTSGGRTIGTWEMVDSKRKINPRDQHDWGGYQFTKDHRLRLKDELKTVWTYVDAARDLLDGDRATLAKANGGKLSHAETIWLDEQEAAIMASGMQELVGQELADFDSNIASWEDKGNDEWQGALTNAGIVGKGLSDSEIRDALKDGGVTHKTMVDDFVNHFESIKTKFHKKAGDFDTLAGNIGNAIETQVSTDQQLAQQLSALGD